MYVSALNMKGRVGVFLDCGGNIEYLNVLARLKHCCHCNIKLCNVISGESVDMLCAVPVLVRIPS